MENILDQTAEDGQDTGAVPLMDGERDLFARHNTMNSVINWQSGEAETVNQLKESYIDDSLSHILESH
eukprot:1351922-Pyramimonas_sp.AAC.1